MLTLLKSEWKAVLFGVMALAIIGGFLYIKAVRAENSELRLIHETNAATIDRLNQELESNRKALIARQLESEELAKQRDEAMTELERLYENDQEANDWGNSVIPDAVYNRLRQ
jgi:hypothetical protein